MSPPRIRLLIIIVAALAVAAFGLLRLFSASDSPRAAAGQATVDSLIAQVNTAEWAKMDHDMSKDAPGYQMPPAMMPGMPQGDDQRLAVTVTVTNTSDQTRPVKPGSEFILHAGNQGRTWAPHSHTFGDLPRLAPRNAVKGVLYFDLPPAELRDGPAWIEWTHGEAASSLTIPMDGVGGDPGHSHNP
jgi:hypothetical protein